MRRVFVLLTAALLSGSVRAGKIEVISRAPAIDDSGAGTSSSPALSADARYVAFSSNAPNLVPGVIDQNGKNDVFLFDRVTSTTILASRSAGNPGRTANGESINPSISGDGRYVSYSSFATDLVPGQVDTNGNTDIFLFDRLTGSNTLVSHSTSSAVTAANSFSFATSMSGDGRYVAFYGEATDLVVGQAGPPFTSNVFRWDRTTGANVLVSHAASFAATGGDSHSSVPVISSDGSTIVYHSFASNLVAGQAGYASSIFSFDGNSGTTILVSHDALSPVRPSDGDSPSVSADGRYVSYLSGGGNLVPGQFSTGVHVFLYDRVEDSNILVSRRVGFPANGANSISSACKLSTDGRFVVFSSYATDLVAGFLDGNGLEATDVYLYDRVADSVSLVSRSQGTESLGANESSDFSDISSDGREVAFWSRGTDLISGQVGGGGTDDAFLFDRVSGSVTLASHLPGAPLTAGNGGSDPVAISSDGTFLIFSTLATDIEAGVVDNNGAADLYLFDINAGSNTLVSRRAPDLPNQSAGNFSFTTVTPGVSNVISADGRFVVYLSWATNLVAGQNDTNGGPDVFLADRLTRTSALVSHAAGSTTTAGNASSLNSDPPSISADGRWVAFTSSASDLVAGMTNPTGIYDAFLYDRLSGTNTLITRSMGTLAAANGSSFAPVVSLDGRFVVFSSVATDLVAAQADTNASQDVFLYDRLADTTLLVSHTAGSSTIAGNGFSGYPSISQDGAFVAFTSGATDLAAGRTGAFLFERATGLVTFVGPGVGPVVAVSADGNTVVFTSFNSNVVPGQVGPTLPFAQNVFLFDRLGQTTALVSHSAGSAVTTGAGTSSQPSLSADGRFIAFASTAADLVANAADTNGRSDVFLFDRADGSVTLVSAASGATLAASSGSSSSPVVSSDGSRVAFISDAMNLVSGQTTAAGAVNVFLYTRASGNSVLASGAGSSPTMGGDGGVFYQPTLNADGSVVVYCSGASDLVPGDFNWTLDVFAFEVTYTAPSTSFYTLTPCRVVDTRGPAGPFGAPALAGNASRSFALLDQCGIPLDAVAVSANVTVVGPKSSGVLSFHPAGFAATQASTLSYAVGQVRANNSVLGLGVAGATAVDVSGSGSVDLILDVNGYFK